VRWEGQECVFGGAGFCGEPFVCESFFGGDAGGGVVLEEPADELKAERRLEALANPGLEVDSILFQSEHVLVFWHVYETGPLIQIGRTKDFENLDDLVFLEGDIFLVIELGFLALEDGAETEQFGEDTTNGPTVDCFCIVFGAHEEFGSAVPDGNYNFITDIEGLKGVVGEAC